MANKSSSASTIEIAMAIVVLAIVSVVALPQISPQTDKKNADNTLEASIDKVHSAYAIAIAKKSGFPSVSEIVAFIDAEFAAEMSDRSGIIFRDYTGRVMVKTYNDAQCRKLTSMSSPGESDIVRCIQKSQHL